MASPEACNVLRKADSGQLIVAADFAANGRTTATFRELVGMLRVDDNVWELAPVPYGREVGMTGQDQAARWAHDLQDSGLRVRALIGFCAGSVYAGALAERIAAWQEAPRLILIDPSLAERQMLVEHLERWLGRLGPAFSPAQLEQARQALRDADASAGDPLALAAALAKLYRQIIRPALVRAGHSAEASEELTGIVTGFLHWLAGAAQLDPRAAWSVATALSSQTPGFGLLPAAERADLVATATYFDVPHADLLRSAAVAQAVDDMLI